MSWPGDDDCRGNLRACQPTPRRPTEEAVGLVQERQDCDGAVMEEGGGALFAWVKAELIHREPCLHAFTDADEPV
jgi:hypothetical protein